MSSQEPLFPKFKTRNCLCGNCKRKAHMAEGGFKASGSYTCMIREHGKVTQLRLPVLKGGGGNIDPTILESIYWVGP